MPIVKSYLDENGSHNQKFVNNILVPKLLNFLKHHKNLPTNRQCQNIKKTRAAKTEQDMTDDFANLEENLMDISPDRILNYDETNLSDEPGTKKCLFKRGTKYPERALNFTKSCISIIFAATASGEVLPPYLVYKAERLFDAWCIGGPRKTCYNRTKGGWFDSYCFEDWFLQVAIPWAKSLTGPKVLIGDNLSSHLNVRVLRVPTK
ncbi:hypothetical protein NQ314_019318 [Rhamnusium bicolor]|uniref:DDE-1 domain-containing protein n=1 Tax=Rhamnusium bicolor TaxID=1586634 RepID=A0AAV8WNY4_9CUCU|nr:hypothetical protein NQ314_019318 [Rhamnusium bicolor]